VAEIGAYEAKTHLPRLLDEVAAGATYIITKHGRPVARLVGVAVAPAAGSDVAQALRSARRGVRLGGESLHDMIAEGRP